MTRRIRKMLSRDQLSIIGEIGYIVKKALERDSRVVRLGNLILFSTQTGDAWMLDPADGLALCVARDGVRQNYSVLETTDNFQIAWNARYRVEDDIFVVVSPEGCARSIIGYPTGEIKRGTNTVPRRR